MGTLTYYDHFTECYKIKPDAPQGLIIQRLGEYEKGNCESIEPVLEEVAKMIECSCADVFERGEESL